MARILLMGCGYVGMELARICRKHGDHLTILTRSAQRIDDQKIADLVIQSHWCDPSVSLKTPPIDFAICCVSHRIDESDSQPKNDHATGLSNVLKALAARPKKVVYLSTTGVYSDKVQGEWVDEASTVEPLRAGTRNARNGEIWLSENYAKETIILRPAGIYGPSRIPNLQALRSGELISADPNSFLNLIHVEDLANCIYQVLLREKLQHQVYNIADGNPVLRKEYYQFICESIGAPTPIFSEPCSESNTVKIRSRSQGNKRVSIDRLRNEHLHDLKYPTYRIGLQKLL